MIVPEFWSEAKTKVTERGKQRTIMRFGWSDLSEADAHENAKQRVAEAVERLKRGEKVRLRDHKVAYNGAEGLPIREEIVDRHGDAVITRNSYGALCLNTPDVVFADIDIEAPSNLWLVWFFFIALAISGYWLSRQWDAWWVLAVAIVIGIALSEAFAKTVTRLIDSVRRDPFESARQRIVDFASQNPRWQLRVYRTPKGYRVLVMHSTFDPTKEPAFDFLKKLGSDPLYMRMCRNQKCFRARISPKPWRIDMEHIRPRPGIWPIKEDKRAARRDWVRRYEQQAHGYASCRYEETLGTGHTDRKCESVRSVHDRYCKADQNLELA